MRKYWVATFGNSMVIFLLQNQKPVSGIDDILKDLNLSKYSTCFQTLNFEEFKDLTDNDLKDLGISLIGPRRKLSSKIASLNSTQN